MESRVTKKKTMSDVERYRRNLAALLESRGMTQGELAKKAKVSYVTISRLMTGVMEKPSLPLCEKISTGAGTTTAKLLES